MKVSSRRSRVAWILTLAVFLYGIFAFQQELPPDRSALLSLGDGPRTTAVSAVWSAKNAVAERALRGAPEPLPDPIRLDSPAVVPPRPQRSAAIAPRREPSPVPNSWTVEKGDRLWTIAEKTLGAGSRFEEIVSLNPGIDPGRLTPGQVLRLPAHKGVAAKSPVVKNSPTTTRYHVVASGENLSSIAQRYYSSPDWKLIYEANSDRLSSPDRIAEGLRLVIPLERRPAGRSR